MKSKRILLLPLILSVLPTVPAVLFFDPQRIIPGQSYNERIGWSAIFFLVIYLLSFIGMSVGLLLNREYRIRRPRFWLLTFLLAGALVLLAGGIGQLLFMRGETEVIVHPSQSDAALLLDESSSMEWSGYDDPRKTVALAFTDSLDENVRVQLFGFSGIVKPYSDLIAADSGGKEQLKEGIRRTDLTGCTDFDFALTVAVESLSNGSPERKQAIVLITDGEAEISQETVENVLQSGCVLIAACIAGSSGQSDVPRELAALADRTGGKTVTLPVNADGSVNTAPLEEAYAEAFPGTTEEISVTPDGLLILEQDVSGYQWAVRICTLLICAVIMGIGLFGSLRWKTILFSLVCGAVLAGVIALRGGDYRSVAVSACVLLGAALVMVEQEGEELDV